MKLPNRFAGFILAFLCSSLTMAADKLSVVASFSVLGDITKELGGDKIALTTLVGSNQDSHVYKPTPFDVQTLAKADVIVINGLSFEGWITRLEESSGFTGLRVVASKGANIIDLNEEEHDDEDKHHAQEHKKNNEHKDEDHQQSAAHKGQSEHNHGDQDPHAWHSLANIRVYINNISAALMTADVDHKDYYAVKKQAYLAKIDALEKRLAIKVATVPVAQRQVIISHDAFGYLGRDYHFRFLAPVGLNTQMKPSAADVAQLIRQVKTQNIKALFVENVSDDRLIKQIGRETGAKLGGHLFSDALSAKNEPAATYLKMMEHNIDTLIDELQKTL
ncbi:MAG: zinc ABC transporter substrate-binding protein [Oceanospirillaceae bacterium]